MPKKPTTDAKMEDEELLTAIRAATAQHLQKLEGSNKPYGPQEIEHAKKSLLGCLRNKYLRPQSAICNLMRAKFMIIELILFRDLDERILNTANLADKNDFVELRKLFSLLNADELCNVMMFVKHPLQAITNAEKMFILLEIAKGSTEPKTPPKQDSVVLACCSHLMKVATEYADTLSTVHVKLFIKSVAIIAPWVKDPNSLLYAAETVLVESGLKLTRDEMYKRLSRPRPRFTPKATLICDSKYLIGCEVTATEHGFSIVGAQCTPASNETGDEIDFDKLSPEQQIICAVTDPFEKLFPFPREVSIYHCRDVQDSDDLHVLFGQHAYIELMGFTIVPPLATKKAQDQHGNVVDLASVVPFDRLEGEDLAKYKRILAELNPPKKDSTVPGRPMLAAYNAETDDTCMADCMRPRFGGVVATAAVLACCALAMA